MRERKERTTDDRGRRRLELLEDGWQRAGDSPCLALALFASWRENRISAGSSVRNKANPQRDRGSGIRDQQPCTRSSPPDPCTFVRNKASCPKRGPEAVSRLRIADWIPSCGRTPALWPAETEMCKTNPIWLIGRGPGMSNAQNEPNCPEPIVQNEANLAPGVQEWARTDRIGTASRGRLCKTKPISRAESGVRGPRWAGMGRPHARRLGKGVFCFRRDQPSSILRGGTGMVGTAHPTGVLSEG